MTIPASRRDELRRLVERSRSATDMYQQAMHEVRNAVPDLLDEIDRLECMQFQEAATTLALSESNQAKDDEIANLEAVVRDRDATLASLGSMLSPEQFEWSRIDLECGALRLKQDLGEARLVIEQQDRDLERTRAALTEAINWIADRCEDGEAMIVDRMRKVLG